MTVLSGPDDGVQSVMLREYAQRLVRTVVAARKPPAKPSPRVDLDEHGDWRIWIYEPSNVHDLQFRIHWWPILWLRFGSRELAEDHLELYGPR